MAFDIGETVICSIEIKDEVKYIATDVSRITIETESFTLE